MVVRARADRDGVGRGVRVGRGELADAEAGERLHHRALVIGRDGRLPLMAVALRAAVVGGHQACKGRDGERSQVVVVEVLGEEIAVGGGRWEVLGEWKGGW